MFKSVMLCYDGSEHARRALKRAAELAILVGAEVHVLFIVRSDVLSAAVIVMAAGSVCLVDEERDHQKLLDEGVERLRARGIKAKGYLAHGDTIDQIVTHAKQLAVDLVVVGHYPSSAGRRWWSGPERGSLAERVNCCVFIAVASDVLRPS